MRAFAHIEKRNPGAFADAAGAMSLAMPSYSISSTFHKPDITARSTGACPSEWRLYWIAESHRTGTDWVSLLAAAQSALTQLRIVHGVSSDARR